MQDFKKAWKRHRKLPKFYAQSSLRVTPQHQFIRELRVSIMSWSTKELDQFLEDMNHEKVKGGAYEKAIAVREIIDQTFDVFDNGSELLSDGEKIRELLRAKI